MIPEIDGLVAADVAVLLFYGEHRWRIAAPPSTMAANTPVSQSHASRRCKALTRAGLLEIADDRGYYRITNLGIRYINGDMDDEHADIVRENLDEND